MPLQATSGAASYDAFGGGVPVVPTYIEDVMSTFLYTGNSSTQTINNGIDLSTKGGLVWIKGRGQLSGGTDVDNILFDSARGASKILYSNLTDAESTTSWSTAFNNNGFSFNTASGYVNSSSLTVGYASWTFRKQPKFFDVVTLTYTSGAAVFNHSLGSTPGFVILKVFDGYADNWWVYHRSLGNDQYLSLNLTSQAQTSTGIFSATSTTFTVKNGIFGPSSIIAYLYAHDAGGFGLTGTDNVISCGSTTVASANAVVTLGWEPQYVLYKQSNAAGGWVIIDSMRGLTANIIANNSRILFAQNSNSEETNNGPALTSTGFILPYAGGDSHGNGDYIYIAIRKGPMKVPTSGSSVFAPVTATAPSSPYTVTTNFPVDLSINSLRDVSAGKSFNDRLRGGSTTSYVGLNSNSTATETTAAGYGLGFASNTSIIDKDWQSGTGANPIYWNFRRAPAFFDEVCYTGTGAAGLTVAHNLAVVPDLMIVKGRSIAEEWNVYFGNNTNYLKLNRNDVPQTSTTRWNDTSPTSSVFSLGTSNWVNGSGSTYVAYLFATLAGVSKVFSYTGNGSSQTINCGFTSGARFVLIKRTDAIGDWYVWDSARGIVSGNDPYLRLNITAAEVTSDDSIDTDSTGFVVNQVSANNVNVSSATYIGLAIA
jgi:hypothetical protein